MLTATGLGSGLDIESLVTQLMAAERAPLEGRLLRQENEVTGLISGMGSFSGLLGTLDTAATTLSTSSTYSTLAVSSDNEAAVAVTPISGGVAADYSVSVSNLAQSQSLVSGSFASTDTVVGTGTLTIAVGTPSYSLSTPSEYDSFSQDGTGTDVVITSSNNTLAAVVSAINDSSAGVNASIVQDGSQYRLMISSSDSGLAKSIRLSVAGDGDSSDTDSAGLSALNFNETTANLSQSQAAADASFSVNGLSLTSSSNELSQVIPGAKLVLKSLTSSPATVRLTNDVAAVKGEIESFVNAYNSFVTEASALTAYDPLTGSAGALQGDSLSRSILSNVRSQISSSVSGMSTAYSALAEIGITTAPDGTLTIDSTTLDSALTTNFDDVKALFDGDGTAAGVADAVSSTLDAYLGLSGLIDSRVSGLNEQIASIAIDRLELDRRMALAEARYRQRFNTMDSLLAQITSTGDYLTQQLDSLPGYDNMTKK